MKKFTILFLSLILILTVFTACGGSESQAETPEPAESQENTETQADETLPLRHVEMTIKDYGTVKLELDPNEAPVSVENFIKLASDGFYDGLKFHRIMDGFMIQGGANPGVELEPIVGEFTSNGYENNISHTEGIISMARTQDPNSATSQFFITVADDHMVINNVPEPGEGLNFIMYGSIQQGLASHIERLSALLISDRFSDAAEALVNNMQLLIETAGE